MLIGKHTRWRGLIKGEQRKSLFLVSIISQKGNDKQCEICFDMFILPIDCQSSCNSH